MEYTRTTYIEFLFHSGQEERLGRMAREIANRDIHDIPALNIPDGVFGFRFYDVLTATVEVSEKIVVLSSETLNYSGTYYYGGTLISEAKAEAESGQAPTHYSVLDYMREQGCTQAIKVRKEIWMPFREEDVYLEPVA